MGNAHTKESRGSSRLYPDGPGGHGSERDDRDRARARRSSRQELTALGLGFATSSSSRSQDAPFERRETRQEREARRLERERVARAKERERSMKEEHVDGGYLVTMGVYTSSEDYSKPVVRQLQLERRLAPFWRGLDDFESNWAEHQIIAAARGVEIPPADHVPEHLIPRPTTADGPGASTSNINNLTVPMGPRTMSSSSDRAGSQPGSSLPSPTSANSSRSGFKPHKKALSAALNLARPGQQPDTIGREITLSNDPFVNGQPLEVFLYKSGEECPLCLMYYPPYMNRTRCCDQLICSECFVQIKRPDPHLPEHHGEPGSSEPPANPEESSGQLVMEAAKCPYCTQTEFGVTYDPPPFRRGLAYAPAQHGVGSMGAAMSSSSSLNSPGFPPSTTGPTGRKRGISLSATAPNVVTIDRVRPDWSLKLAAAINHQRRRAAAADALHAATFMMGNNEPRSLFGRSARFSRRPGRDARGGENPGENSQPTQANERPEEPRITPPEAGPRTSSARTGPARDRVDPAHLESLMMAEAIRLSLADEDERQKKAEKEARKDAKKRDKEDAKSAKKNKGNIYGESGPASRSSSSLSVNLLGRRRGNSGGASNSIPEADIPGEGPATPSPPADNEGKGKAVDRSVDEESPSQAGLIAQPPRGTSHLRQMSNASSVSSSGLDTTPGSQAAQPPAGALDTTRTASSVDGPAEEGDGSNPNLLEPLFNFRSLAEMVGVPIDGEVDAQEKDGQPSHDNKTEEGQHTTGEHIEHASAAPEQSAPRAGGPKPQTERPGAEASTAESAEHSGAAPNVVVTPNTPVVGADGDSGSAKQLAQVVSVPETTTQIS